MRSRRRLQRCNFDHRCKQHAPQNVCDRKLAHTARSLREREPAHPTLCTGSRPRASVIVIAFLSCRDCATPIAQNGSEPTVSFFVLNPGQRYRKADRHVHNTQRKLTPRTDGGSFAPLDRERAPHSLVFVCDGRVVKSTVKDPRLRRRLAPAFLRTMPRARPDAEACRRGAS